MFKRLPVLLAVVLLACESKADREAREALGELQAAAAKGDVQALATAYRGGDNTLRLFGTKSSRRAFHQKAAAAVREHWDAVSKGILGAAADGTCEVPGGDMMKTLAGDDPGLEAQWKTLHQSFRQACEPAKAAREAQAQAQDAAQQQAAIAEVKGQVLVSWKEAATMLDSDVDSIIGVGKDPCVNKIVARAAGSATWKTVDKEKLSPYVRDAAEAFVEVDTSVHETRVELPKGDLQIHGRPTLGKVVLEAAAHELKDAPSVEVPTDLDLRVSLRRAGKEQHWAVKGTVPVAPGERVTDAYVRHQRLDQLWVAACSELDKQVR